MLFRKKNGQVSIEILAILGVLIIGSIILASFYISNINKKTSEITSLDKSSDNFNNWLNDSGNGGTLNDGGGTGTGGGTGGAFCGDHIKNGTEQCDDPDLGGATCATATNNSSSTGTLACNPDCTFDTSQCSASPFCGDGVVNGTEQCDGSDLGGATCATVVGSGSTGTLACNPDCTFDTSQCGAPNPATNYTFDISPATGSGFVNKPYTGMDFDLQINNSNTTVDVNVSVKKGVVFTSDCSIDGHYIAANANGYHMGDYTSTTEYHPTLECNDAGTYTFKFDTSDHNSISETTFQKVFTLTTTATSDYALCSSSSNENGSLNICVNNFTATTTNNNGTLQIFVNQPDNKEVTNTSCTNNSNGTLCISIGNT